MQTLSHGGRLHAARRRYPHAPGPFIDLSTGINPDAYPVPALPADVWRRLPEPEDIRRLEAAAAAAYGVIDAAMVVAAPGTQALLHLLPQLVPQSAIAIPAPTYGEHAAVWGAGGAAVFGGGIGEHRAAVLCNPNNPDGTRHSPDALAALAARLDLLVVDEAFADFEPGLSFAPRLPCRNVVILRSFGKSYGLAGVRLAFALAEPGLAGRIRVGLGPWAVSGPAIAIGIQALADTGWRDAAARAAWVGAARLDAVLTGAGLDVVGGTGLFRLAAMPAAAVFAERLGEAGILVRSFEDQPEWLRFGLPGDEVAWGRLARAF